MVDLAIIQTAIVVHVHLVKAHHASNRHGIEVVGQQAQILFEQAGIQQVSGKATQGKVVEGKEVVETHALVSLQHHLVGFLQHILRRRQERTRHVVDQVKHQGLSLGTSALAHAVPPLVQLPHRIHGARKHPGAALGVGAIGLVEGNGADQMGPGACEQVHQPRMLGLKEQRQVGADQNFAPCCLSAPRRLFQEPSKVRMKLRRPSRNVHDGEAASGKALQHRLHGFPGHGLGSAGVAVQIAVPAGQIARVGDVDLHGRGTLPRLQQTGLAHALFEAHVPQLVVGPVEHAGGHGFATLAHLQGKLGGIGAEGAAMLPGLGNAEVPAVSGSLQHASRVAADRLGPALDEARVLVKVKVPRHFPHAAVVDGELPVVFLGGLKSFALDGPHGAAGKAHKAHLGLQGQVVHVHLVHHVEDEAIKARGLHLGAEVLQVQRATQTLPHEHGVVSQGLGHAAIGVHVAEVQLAARLQHPMDFGKHQVLEGRKVHHAVGHHQVNALVFDPGALQVLDVAQPELHVAFRIPEALRLLLLVLPGNL